MKYVFLFFSFSISLQLALAQNKQILYDFGEVPQQLMLNPGATFDHKAYIGIPLLSQFSFNIGVTGFSAYDIFKDDGVNINTKIRDVLYGLDVKDNIFISQQLEILSGGFQINEKHFLSFGWYQEADLIAYLPSNFVPLIYEGNLELNKRYDVDDVAIRANMMSVLHAGIHRKVSDKLRIGGRLKLYMGMFNAQTSNNTGTYYTTEETDGSIRYIHHLENVNATVHTSGLPDTESDVEIGPSFFTSKLLNGNLGLGIDLGFSYFPNDDIELSASLIDLGFISYSQDVKSYKANGDYEIDGIQVDFDVENPEDYWNSIKNDFEEKVPVDTLYTHYTSWRPLKFNAATKYKFGKKNRFRDCSSGAMDNLRHNAIGLQYYSIVLPKTIEHALTFFYERNFSSFLDAKITYTMDRYSSTNVGLGLATYLGKFNLYLAADNLLQLSNVAKAQNASLQIGMNLILD